MTTALSTSAAAFPLGIGETLKVVFDNPTERVFFKGYFIRLNGGTGGTNGNICNVGYGCSHPNFPDGYPVAKNNLYHVRVLHLRRMGDSTMRPVAGIGVS